MREIKFRAWLRTQKMMASYISGLKHAPDCGVFEITVPFDEGRLRTFRQLHAIDEFVLMQFTGLKVSFGIEVYEGDILQDGDGDYQGQVVWLDSEGAFCLDDGQDTVIDLCDVSRNWEVIGNIYENSDLLK